MKVYTVKEWFYDKLNTEAMSYRVFLDGCYQYLYDASYMRDYDSQDGCDHLIVRDDTSLLVEEELFETEDAVKVKISGETITGDYHSFTTWIPKSVITSRNAETVWVDVPPSGRTMMLLNQKERGSSMTIKEARKLAGWTQANLSQELGIPRRTIEDWERGISSTSDWCERLIVREILKNVKVNPMTIVDENDRIAYVVYEDVYEVPYHDGMTKQELEAAFWARVDTCEREVARYDTQAEALLALADLERKAFASVESFTNGRHVRGKAFFVREEEVDEDGDFVTGGDVLHTVYGEF